jgi:hypothetical protein
MLSAITRLPRGTRTVTCHSSIDRITSAQHDWGESMQFDGASDHLLVVIFVLAAVCLTRWIYIETPLGDFGPYRDAETVTWPVGNS